MDSMCMFNALSEVYINYYNSMFVQLPAGHLGGWSHVKSTSTFFDNQTYVVKLVNEFMLQKTVFF